MQTFNSVDTRHPFEVDGRKLFLPGMKPEDIADFGALGEIKDQVEQFTVMRTLLEKRVGPSLTWWQRLTFRKSPASVIHGMSFQQLGSLFKAWSGMNLGNSSSSSN